MLARKVPHGFRKKALTYGMIGAVVLRLIAVLLASRLLQWRFVKLLGGAYLLYVAGKHLWTTSHRHHEHQQATPDDEIVADATPTGENAGSFWRIVISIELTDMAFAVDSVLAAIALVGEAPPGTPITQLHPKLWVVMFGGLIGVVAMRFAAVIFIRMLERFPRFELSAYLMVLVIGLKLILEWAFNGRREVLNFQSPHAAAFWTFWLTIAALFGIGFIPRKVRHLEMANT